MQKAKIIPEKLISIRRNRRLSWLKLLCGLIGCCVVLAIVFRYSFLAVRSFCAESLLCVLFIISVIGIFYFLIT